MVLPRLKIVAPFWAISIAHAHLISFFALERSMVLCLTYETLTSPLVSIVVVVVFSRILLPIEG
jgi:uncharacterized membrane protein